METENDQTKNESVSLNTNKELNDKDVEQERGEDAKTETVNETESSRKRSIDDVEETEEQGDITVKKSKTENENIEEENGEQEENSEKYETNNKNEQSETVSSIDAITNGDSQESLESKDSSPNSGGDDKPVVNGVNDSASRKDDDDDNQSVVPSEDSEKENRQTDLDLPMDLSTKSGGSSTGNGPDVIMLSDSEEELMAGMMNGDMKELSMDELKKRKKLIKQLQTELRNEEAKLVLLKKLRQSQISHQLQDHNSVSNRQQSPRQQPPPLVRGSQIQGQARPAHAHNQPPQLMRGNQGMNSRGHQGPPPLVNMGNQRGVENRHSVQQSQQQQNQRMGGYQGGMMPGQSMPNSMGGYRSGGMSVPQNQQQSMQQVDNQTPAQRQAAAKMALRKQLEKTLLQIPPPKPPPPEMNFVPSLATPDFIYLLGLEEAVNYIIDADLISKGQKNPDEKMVCTPFTCVQCRTDFTPVWKREKPGSKNVICEHCVTTNQKKALKQEHTNRLKSAFVKALQQEQEIERMQSQASANTPSVAAATSAPPTQSMPSSPMNASSAPFTSPSEALRQHQNFIQAHQVAAQTALRMGQPLGMTPFRGGFPYQIPFGAKASDVQLHRQYLLDMIPNRAPMSWKQ